MFTQAAWLSGSRRKEKSHSGKTRSEKTSRTHLQTQGALLLDMAEEVWVCVWMMSSLYLVNFHTLHSTFRNETL